MLEILQARSIPKQTAVNCTQEEMWVSQLINESRNGYPDLLSPDLRTTYQCSPPTCESSFWVYALFSQQALLLNVDVATL